MQLDYILDKARAEETLSRDEIIYLLTLDQPRDREKVFALARELRTQYFAKSIFLYGFVYFSTYCRNNCAFCLYRKTNQDYPRYRKTRQEIVETARQLAADGVHLLDLTMGEDPEYLEGREGFTSLLELVSAVRETSGLPLMISPGLVSDRELHKFQAAGVDWYACYQETHNRELFKQLRLGQSYDARLRRKVHARKQGMLIEEGLLTGVGETVEDIADSLRVMGEIGAQQVRVMSFVPQEGTPMSGWQSPDRKRELMIIALMRLLGPNRLIPASLDVDGIEGLEERLAAGANVVTSIIPPQSDLAGVAHSTLDIHEGNRSVRRVVEILRHNGLELASQEEFDNWTREQKKAAAGQREDAV